VRDLAAACGATVDLFPRVVVLHLAPHEGAEADERRVAPTLGHDEDLLAAAAVVAAVRATTSAAHVALALAELVATELVELFEAEIFGFVAELQQNVETLWRLGLAAAEGRRAREGSVRGRRAQIS
jgi:hypothetical protein